MDAHPSRAEAAARLALWITVGLVIAKSLVWWLTGSLAVLSQALDSGVDIAALALVLFGVRIARKPADASHHYGHGKAENLVAYTQILLLASVGIAIAVEAVRRLLGPVPTVDTPWYAFVMLGASALADMYRARVMLAAARADRSDALMAGALNVASDIGTALVALASLAFVRAGALDADALGSLVVVAIVAVGGLRLGRRSVDVLMDRAPGRPVEAIQEAAAGAPGVGSARRVRVRDVGGQLFADVTVTAGRTASLERAHDIAEGVEEAIERVAPGTDVVVHVEPSAEAGGMVERVLASASRVEGVHEVHNVFVHAFQDGSRSRLHATLHAKVAPRTSLASAHGLADLIEDAVRAELGEDTRVDTHIEPLEPTSWGEDVTEQSADLVAEVERMALDEPDVVDCHEVIVTSTGGQLSITAHVRGRGDLPLTRIHDASRRIENAIHAAHPEIGAVLIHFEPS